MVILSAPDEASLLAKQAHAEGFGIKTKAFFETDFGAHHSAFATEPISGDKRKAFANDRLWRAEACR